MNPPTVFCPNWRCSILQAHPVEGEYSLEAMQLYYFINIAAYVADEKDKGQEFSENENLPTLPQSE